MKTGSTPSHVANRRIQMSNGRVEIICLLDARGLFYRCCKVAPQLCSKNNQSTCDGLCHRDDRVNFIFQACPRVDNGPEYPFAVAELRRAERRPALDGLRPRRAIRQDL